MLDRITQSTLTKGALAIAAVLMLVIMNLAVAVPTYAQAPTPQANRPNSRNDMRERQFKREQTWFETQTKVLTHAGTIATNVQSYIDAQNALGKDTSSLVTALATFNAQVAKAQSSHDTAGTLIDAHAGFDANGTVTDLQQATQTVINVRKSLMDAHKTLRQAVIDLRKAIRAYRQANPRS